MKVYYMNDEQKDITVRIMDLTYDDTFTKSNNLNTYHRLKATEGRVFDLQVPEGSALYVKKWKDVVMLSYLEESVLESMLQSEREQRVQASESKDQKSRDQ